MKCFSAIAALALVAALGAKPAQAAELTNGRVTIDLDTNPIFTAPDQDRVDSISWIQSDGTSTGNLAVNSGTEIADCGEPQEFFGQSYDEGSVPGTPVDVIVAGSLSKWTDGEPGLNGISTATQTKTCARALQGVAKTAYAVFTQAPVANAVRISRTVNFLVGAKGATTNFRAYVPRLSFNIYNDLLLPETDGAFHVIANIDRTCTCDITSWAGKWFALDNGKGYGMMVIRDASSTWPATLANDNDDGSQSNLDAVSLIAPSGGFTGTLTETEWLCFYDPTSWPQGRREKEELPAGCAVKD